MVVMWSSKFLFWDFFCSRQIVPDEPRMEGGWWEPASKGVSYISPFWNHILGLLYVEIAKIVETWKLAKKFVPRWGFQPGTNITITIVAVSAIHHPTSSVSGHFIYIPDKNWIHHNICELYEFIGHRRYEFMLFNVWIHILRRDMWGAAHIIIAQTN